MNLLRPAALATLAALLAATLPASAEGELYNPDPNKCGYVDITINVTAPVSGTANKPDEPPDVVIGEKKEYKVSVKVGLNTSIPTGHTVNITSVSLKRDDRTYVIPSAVPAATPYEGDFTITGADAEIGSKWHVIVQTDSYRPEAPAAEKNDPCTRPFILDGECTACSNCNITSSPTVSNDGGGYTEDLSLGSSAAGESNGIIRFHSNDLSFPDLEQGISVFVPSSVAVTRTLADPSAVHSPTNKFVKITVTTPTTIIVAEP